MAVLHSEYFRYGLHSSSTLSSCIFTKGNAVLKFKGFQVNNVAQFLWILNPQVGSTSRIHRFCPCHAVPLSKLAQNEVDINLANALFHTCARHY